MIFPAYLTAASLPSLGAWIETRVTVFNRSDTIGRSLHWERGLKHRSQLDIGQSMLSLPSLGAWIETQINRTYSTETRRRSLHWERGLKHVMAGSSCPGICRSLHWERGLKQYQSDQSYERRRRSLHWERGLKQVQHGLAILDPTSLPSLGAWIETHHRNSSV